MHLFFSSEVRVATTFIKKPSAFAEETITESHNGPQYREQQTVVCSAPVDASPIKPLHLRLSENNRKGTKTL